MSVTVEPPLSTEAVLGRVRDLLPAIRERVPATEAHRTIPAESAQEFLDAGLARVLLPRAYGGLELGLHAWIDAVVEISAADASHGWCASLIIHHPHYLAQFPEAAQAAAWADGPDVSIAGALAPVMRIDPVAGGYRVSGESHFASGVNHSTWIFVGGMTPGPQGDDEWTSFLIPPGRYKVLDTWDTIAMRGTGSNTVVVTDVFVPADHTLRISQMREGDTPGGKLHDAPFFRAPWVTYAPLSFVAPMLGAARGALEDYRAWTAERSSLHGSAVAGYTSIQVRLARCAADLDAAEMLIRRTVDVASAPEPASMELRARANRDTCRASELIVSAMDTIMTISGSAGFRTTNHIQQAWRDVHLASSHVILNPETGLAAWGRQALGLEPDPYQQWY